ncbi:hypothetical protein TB1_026437 [Malus domestica]
MPDVFTDLTRVTRSHIPAANMPTKMDVNHLPLTQKHGRPLGLNDLHPQKRKPTTQGPVELTVNLNIAYSFYPTHEKILDYGSVLEKVNLPNENREISVYYASLDDVWHRNSIMH